MKVEESGSLLRIYLEGRIDSVSAPGLEKEIVDIIDAHKGMDVVLDAEELTYISSAGLRVLLKVRKMYDHPLKVLNVSRDVYDIFETTGFTDLLDVKKAYRSISVDGLEVIGQGFYGTVYRLDAERIVKVYKGKESIPMIENEKAMAQKAFLAGIPTAISYDIVRVGEDYGSVFELLNARTFHEIVQKNEKPLQDIITKYTDLLKLMHHTKLEAGAFPSYKERYLEYLEVIKKHLTQEQYEGLKKRVSDMREEYTVIHGDIQMKNVMLVDDEAMLIDMDTLGLGDPVFDFAGLYVTYQLFEEDDPNNAMSFLGMPQELVDELWNRIIDSYFQFSNAADRLSTIEKIALVASIRFLFLLESTDLKEGDLGKKRITHTKEHIDELLKVVDTVEICAD